MNESINRKFSSTVASGYCAPFAQGLKRWFSKFIAIAGCLVIALSTLFNPLSQAHAQDTNANQSATANAFQRKIFVPFESLDVLLDGNSNRVLLSQDEYQELLKSARTREIRRAPVDSAIVSAKYTGNISEGVASITGELVVEALNEGLVQIPLTFSGVAIRSARLGDLPAKLWRNEKGQVVLLTSSEFRETLTVEMTVPLQTSAARQTMSIQLPSPSATRFSLNVPGNVEVKSGVPVVNRAYDKDKNITAFDLLATREAMNIVMSLNNRLLKDDQVVVSRSVMIHKLTPHVQEMHVTCSVDVIHGAVEQMELMVPSGFQVSQVSTELLSQWEIAEPRPDVTETGKRLIVKLRQPTREDFVLSITAARNVGVAGQWTAEDIRPQGVAGHVSVVGVLADIELTSSKLNSKGVIPIDHEFLLAAIPDSVRTNVQSNPVAVVAAYYAPQRDYSITSNFSVPDPELIVKSNSRLVIDNQRLELQGGLSLVSRYDSRFEFKMSLPDGWRLNELTDIKGQPVRFDRAGVEGSSDFLVHLSARIPSKSSTKVFYKASLTPGGWLEQWESNQVQFPSLKIEGESKHTGAIAVSTDEDLRIKPTQVTNLEPLAEEDKKTFELDRKNAPLAYQFKQSSFKLDLTLDRLKSSILARTYNYFTVKPSQLLFHGELIYDVKQADEGELVFDLPLESPKSISITGNQDRLKDYSSEDTESCRRWTVQLAKPRKGRVHLMVDFAMPMDESQLSDLKLVPAVIQDVSFQSTMVAIEGSTELDIEIESTGRVVDVGEFSEARYQPGRFMLGAYSWPDEDVSVTVNSTRRPVYELPSAIVQRAEMVTSISTNGKAQTAARFQLVTKQQPFLRIELPEEATLWSVQLDGQPAKPQLQNGALLISLIGNEIGKLRDLQLVFESPASSFKFVGQIQAEAPTLWLNESANASGVPVPLVDLHWRLIMPDGFNVSHGDGMFQSDQLVDRRSPIEQLGLWVYRLGGGIGGFGLAGNYYDAAQKRAVMVSAAPSAMNAAEPFLEFSDEEVSVYGEPNGAIGGMGGKNKANAKNLPNPPPLPPIPAQDGEPGNFKRPGGFSGSSKGEGPAVNDPFGDPSSASASGKDKDGDKEGFKQAKFWALSGLRSLNIELTDSGNAIDFYNLGEQPVLNATIVNQSRINWVAIALAFLIAAVGVMLTNRKLTSKFLFVILVLLIACLVPLAGVGFDAFRTIVDLSILSAVLVAIYFVVAALIRRLGRSFSAVVARVPLLLLLLVVGLGLTNQAEGQQVVNDAEQLKKLLSVLQSEPDVDLPNDAIIIPFDAEDPQGRENANRLLVPYEHYLNLINKAQLDPDKNVIASPVGFVLSSAKYQVKLTLDEDVSIRGELMIEVLTDEPVTVSLPMIGGALADAKVDGEPAKLQFGTLTAPVTKTKARKNAAQQKTDASVVQLHLEGKGTKKFNFTVQIKPARQGGWRILNARLPIGMTRGLDLTSLNEPAEIRLNSDADRRAVEAKPNQQVSTVLSADGSLRLQWKPSTANQAIDQSLTANSEAILDVREDGLRMTWRVDLDFRGSERNVFTLNLPKGFLVEQVSGENVRAWDVKLDNDQHRLDVTTLSAAKDKEMLVIELSRRDFSIGESKTGFDAPYLTVEGAALHQGVYVIRRSPIIEVKTTEHRAASRVDANQVARQIDVKSLDSKSSPFGIEEFQVLQFVTTPFQIGLEAQRVPRTLMADTQSIFRIGQSEADLEMRINVAVGQRPIHKFSFDIPDDVEIRRLSAGKKETWTSESIDDVQRIDLFFPSGITSDFSIIVEADLAAYSGEPQWAIPRIKMHDVSEQSGLIAVQVDPALSVTTGELQNCETILMRQVESWLNRSQRSTTRLALRTRGADYAATLKFTKILPRVSVETVTNVRTTLFAIEETMLLDFNIQQAGIRQIQFELPAAMRTARIIAKLVSETIVEDVDDDPNAVRVIMNLQDDVIGSYRIVVENDRQLSDSRQNVPMPRVLTGVTEQRYATLQNAGRDEIEALPSEDFQTLNRQLKQFATLKQKIAGGEVAMAYVCQSNVDWPRLQYETRQREVFDTVAASIEFSKTVMVVDSSGAYRALQNFQVNNRSEQYLEIELPEGAQLLTVVVEGQPVKPVAWPGANNDRRLRIPLVKTPLGDLDYPVQLKFAGRLGDLSNFSEIEFPVVNTLNISVQSSQLHLRLPDSHRWMNFGGTMTKVDDRGKLEESYLSYKRRQIEQLAEQIQSSSSKIGSFSKSRAYSNLKQLENDMIEFQTANPGLQLSSQNNQLGELYFQNNQAIQLAQEIYSRGTSQSEEMQIDNRANFNELVEGQSYQIARNSVTRQGQNFRQSQAGSQQARDYVQSQQQAQAAVKQPPALQQGKKAFDSRWLERNKLNIVQGQLQSDSPSRKSESSRSQIVLSEADSESDDEISFVNPADSSRLVKEARENALNKSKANKPMDAGGLGGAISGKSRRQSQPDGSDRFQGFTYEAKGMGLVDNSSSTITPEARVGMGGSAAMDEGEQEGGRGVGLGGGGGGRGAVENGGPFGESSVELSRQRERRSKYSGVRLAGDSDDSKLSAAVLSSLEIELPQRGVDFYFKSPRGKATVVVRPVATQSFSRWMSALITVAICAGVWITVWLVMWFCRKTTIRVLGTLMLLLAGMVSLVSGVLPVYGFIALATAVIMFIDWGTRKLWGTDSPELI